MPFWALTSLYSKFLVRIYYIYSPQNYKTSWSLFLCVNVCGAINNDKIYIKLWYVVYNIKTSNVNSCFHCRQIFAMVHNKHYKRLLPVQKMIDRILRDQNQRSAIATHHVWENHWYIIVSDMRDTWWKYVLLEQKLKVFSILYICLLFFFNLVRYSWVQYIFTKISTIQFIDF